MCKCVPKLVKLKEMWPVNEPYNIWCNTSEHCLIDVLSTLQQCTLTYSVCYTLTFSQTAGASSLSFTSSRKHTLLVYIMPHCLTADVNVKSSYVHKVCSYKTLPWESVKSVNQRKKSQFTLNLTWNIHTKTAFCQIIMPQLWKNEIWFVSKVVRLL